MAQVLNSGPGGDTVLQDDGSIITLPPGAGGQFGPPPEAPVPGMGAPPLVDAAGNLPPGPQGPAPALPAVPPAAALPPSAGVSSAAGQPAPVPAPIPAPPASPVHPDSGAQPAGRPSPALPPMPDLKSADPFEAEAAAATMAGEAAIAKSQAEDATYAAAKERQLRLQSAEDARRAQADEQRQVLLQKADAATQAYADAKITEPRPGSVQILAMILGGIGTAMAKESRNPVIDQWERMKAENVRQQEADRAKLGELADRAGAGLDRHVAWAKDSEARFHQTMAGEYQVLENDLRATAAKYGGPVAQANALKAIAEVGQRKQEHLGQVAEREWNHQNAEARLALDQLQTTESIRASRASTAQGWSRIDLDKKQFAEGVRQADRAFGEGARQFDATLEVRKKELEADAYKAAQSGNVAQAKMLQERADRMHELGVPAIVPTIGADGTPEYGTIKRKDGTDATFRGKEEAKEVRTKMEASEKISKIADNLINLIADKGWSSDTLRSAEWQQAKSDFASLGLAQKDLQHLGVLAGPDMGLIHSLFGGEDPTAVRDIIPGLRRMKANMGIEVTAAVRKHSDYDGPPIVFPENTRFGDLEKTKNTPEQDLVRRAQAGRLDPMAAVTGGTERLRRNQAQAGGVFGDLAEGRRIDQYPSADAEAAIVGLAAAALQQKPGAIDGLRALARDPNPVIRQAVAEIAYKNRLDLGEGAPVRAADYEAIDRANPIRQLTGGQ